MSFLRAMFYQFLKDDSVFTTQVVRFSKRNSKGIHGFYRFGFFAFHCEDYVFGVVCLYSV